MKKENTNNILAVYGDSPLFINFDQKELKELADLSSFRQYKKDDLIFMEGDPVKTLFFLAEGRVKIFKTSPSFVMSDGNGRRLSLFPSSCTNLFNFLLFLPTRTTLHPSETSFLLISFPTVPLAPVTIATLFCNFKN